MTCRCCRNTGRHPYEIADVPAFVDLLPPDRQQPAAGGPDVNSATDTAAARVSPAVAYRFAWSG
jgi:hypothetical protein